jgi:transcriptional regulator GlxA family with amidase domain
VLAAHRRARRTASICTGAFILAEAGLLDGKRATTHWHSARELQSRFPAVQVQEDRIYVRDGNVWTSAGMTAYVDLMLAMVEADLGSEASRAVARKMVVHHRRAGGQSQFSFFSEIEADSDRVQRALDHAKKHLRDDLSVESLAAVVHLSARQFSRAFRRDTGESPARAIERLRVEAARQLVETAQLSIERIAAQTGFGDPERLRRAFIRAYGQPPQVLKRAAQLRKDEELAMS